MTDVHSETTGTGLVPSGVNGAVGQYDLWGNKIINIKQETGQQLVEHGVITLKSGEVIDLTYKDYERLLGFIEAGSKGILAFNGGQTSIDTVMIGKMETKKRLEDAPIDMKPNVTDKHLKQRVLTGYEAEINSDGKGWQWKRTTVETGKALIERLKSGEKNITRNIRQLKPLYAMEYVKEVVDGKELLVDRTADFTYADIPLTRINDEGLEVINWYWAKPLNDDDKKSKKRVGFKKVIQLRYNEQIGDYEETRRLDACSPDEIAYLERGGY